MRELALQRRLQLHAIIVIGGFVPLGPTIEPEMLETRRPMILPGQAEAVEILRPQILPVIEQDAELEGRLRRAHEIGFVDPQYAIEIDQRRDRGLADPDRS